MQAIYLTKIWLQRLIKNCHNITILLIFCYTLLVEYTYYIIGIGICV